MAWDFAQQFEYSNAAAYKNRVGQAFLKIAENVINEDPETTDHEARAAFANRVLWGAGVPVRAFQLLPILNTALQVDGGVPSDNDIEYTVSSTWNKFALQPTV